MSNTGQHPLELILLKFQHQPSPNAGKVDSLPRLASSLLPSASAEEVASAWPQAELPAEVSDLWSICRGARLFEDVVYGQWGLVILNPLASALRTTKEREARPADFRIDDIVIGEFLGDLELLIVAPSEEGNRRIMVVLPLDGRSEWFAAASSLPEFFYALLESGGSKFWENSE